jgi:hypothetical protein
MRRRSGPYRASRSVSRPSSGGSVPPSPFATRSLRPHPSVCASRGRAPCSLHGTQRTRRQTGRMHSRPCRRASGSTRAVLTQYCRRWRRSAAPKAATPVRHREYPLPVGASASPRRDSTRVPHQLCTRHAAPAPRCRAPVRRIARCHMLTSARALQYGELGHAADPAPNRPGELVRT